MISINKARAGRLQIASRFRWSLGGIHQAHKTLKHVRGAWVEGQKVEVKDGRITVYRVDLKVTFVLE